jgi:hypothetical protein
MNDFMYRDNQDYEFLYLTITPKVPDQIRALPSKGKWKVMGVMVPKKNNPLYRIGYNGFEWHVGPFDTVIQAGRAFGRFMFYIVIFLKV